MLVQFTTNRAGVLHGKLIRTADNTVVDESIEKQPNVTHTFSFANAFAGTDYFIEAAVYDPTNQADAAGKTVSGKADPLLAFKMPSPPSKPHLSNLAISKTMATSLTFAFDLDSAAALQISCFRVPDASKPDNRITVSAPVQYSKDTFGLNTGPTVSGHKEYSCDGLTAQQSYVAQIDAVDDFDQVPDAKNTVAAALPGPLNFDGPVQVNITATGIQVSWNATVTGATATMTFDSKGKQPGTFPVAASGKSYSTTFSSDQLSNALPSASGTQTGTEPPILTATMTNGTETVVRSFQVVVTVPSSKGSVAAVTKTSGGSPAASKTTTDSLNNVANGVQNPKSKFSWQDVLQTGLGALIKLI